MLIVLHGEWNLQILVRMGTVWVLEVSLAQGSCFAQNSNDVFLVRQKFHISPTQDTAARFRFGDSDRAFMKPIR